MKRQAAGMISLLPERARSEGARSTAAVKIIPVTCLACKNVLGGEEARR